MVFHGPSNEFRPANQCLLFQFHSFFHEKETSEKVTWTMVLLKPDPPFEKNEFKLNYLGQNHLKKICENSNVFTGIYDMIVSYSSKYITAVRLPISLPKYDSSHLRIWYVWSERSAKKEIHRWCLPSLVILSCLTHKLIWLFQDRLNIWSVQKSFQAQKSVGRKMLVSCVSVSRLNRGLRDYGDGAKECFPHLDLTEVNLKRWKNFKSNFWPLQSTFYWLHLHLSSASG